jgi:hypothetical protein
MTTREDYLKRAEECIEMAEQASPEIKKKLHEVAEAWLELAVTQHVPAQGHAKQNAPSSDVLQ